MDDSLKLIVEIRKRPALWDFGSPEHKKHVEETDMWQEVALSMGPNVTIDDCKKKWLNLRAAYMDELKRIEDRILRDLNLRTYHYNKDYSSKWAYFKAMLFIKKPEPREGLSFVSKTTATDKISSDISVNKRNVTNRNIAKSANNTSRNNNCPKNISNDRISTDGDDFDQYANDFNKSEPDHELNIEAYSTVQYMNDFIISEPELVLNKDKNLVDNRSDEFIDNSDNDNCQLFNEDLKEQSTTYYTPRINKLKISGPQNKIQDNKIPISQPSLQDHIKNHSDLPRFKTKFKVLELNKPDHEKDINLSSCSNCNCKNSLNQRDLEKEDQNLVKSPSSDLKGPRDLSHVLDADYNFLISFVPHLKKMSEMQNLHFRAGMTDLLLNIMTQSFSDASGVACSSPQYVSSDEDL